MLDDEAWAAAVDDSLPDGVINLRDHEGRWWRYPLVEFGLRDDDGRWWRYLDAAVTDQTS